MDEEQEACLILHGFTGGPHEVMPLAKHLAARGFNVLAPTLAGHADKMKGLRRVTYLDWIASAEADLVKLLAEHQGVNIIGFSMGGLIGVHLALKYDIKALVMLSAPIYIFDMRRTVENICTGLKNRDYRRIEKYAFNLSRTPLSAVWNFKILLNKTRPLISRVSIPVLVLQGLKDDTVKPKSAGYIYKNVASEKKQIHYLPCSAHVICCDIEKERVFELVTGFLE